MFKKFIFLLALFAVSALAQQPQTSTAPLSAINVKYVNGVAPGYWPTIASGLTLNISDGTANCAGTIVTYSHSSLTMTASTTNFVYLNTSASCAPAVKTSSFTATDIPIAEVVTGSSTITSIADDRTPFQTPGTGVGGSCGSANIPCTNTANTYNGGTQVFQTPNATTVAAFFEGTSTPTTPVLVQDQQATSVTGSTSAAAMTTNPTSGNALIVTVIQNSSGGTGTITDSQGNTFTRVAHDSSSDWISIFVASGITGGADTVTFTGPSSSNPAISVQEWSGIDPASPFDVATVTNGSSLSATQLTGTVVTSGNDLVLSTLFSGRNLNTGLAPTGYTTVDTYNQNANSQITAASSSYSSGSYQATWIQSTNTGNPYATLMVAFKLSAASTQTANLVEYFNGTSVQSGFNGEGSPFVVSTTISALPACSSGVKGVMSAVSDATSPTYLGTLTGGGSTYTPVVCNGSAWVGNQGSSLRSE